jgi:hypothetical protein
MDGQGDRSESRRELIEFCMAVEAGAEALVADPGFTVCAGEIVCAADGTPIPNTEIRRAAVEAVAEARLALAQLACN